MSEVSNWSEHGTYLGQSYNLREKTEGKSKYYSPKIVEKPQEKAGKSSKERKSQEDLNNIEIDNQQQGKNPVHISPTVIVKNDPMDVQGDTTSSESGNEADANPSITEGNEATKDYLEKRKIAFGKIAEERKKPNVTSETGTGCDIHKSQLMNGWIIAKREIYIKSDTLYVMRYDETEFRVCSDLF
ncbi:hypothetical protein JTB14_030478 [Gonioctena quinquepunctata]|nr:hypothetical protein JTB14_030478 [Gonioctena quinquepunctata]